MSSPLDGLDQRKVRIEKLEKIKEAGNLPFAERYERTHYLHDASKLAIDTKDVRVAGRLMAIRKFGKLIFATLQDYSGSMQIALVGKEIPDEFKHFTKVVDIGDFIGCEGYIYTTQKGEITLKVTNWTFLSKTLLPLPEKHSGLKSVESCYRQRYLDLVMNKETMDRFKKRIKMCQVIRRYLEDADFVEIETPVIQNKASGAMATPFKTHHQSLDVDMFLRIAPETYLKRAIAGGFDRVYEFARCFRNEGMDPSHLQDFTLLEYYCAYWNYEDNMNFTEKLIKHVLEKVNGSYQLTYNDTNIDFGQEWKRISFSDLIKQDSGIDIDQHSTKESLVQAIKEKGITLEVDINSLGRGNLIDQLYKKVSRPSIINPTFVIKQPLDLSPLARMNDDNKLIVDRFQLVINGWEVINAYSELIDPLDQRQRLEDQNQAKEGGDTEAMEMDEDYLLCMEHGMPPISGWGMGIDRLIALLTNSENLRDVVLFPLMKQDH
ncbi:MAG: lysine--tRNA ligase [Planctomycetota bacterium]|nr:MAG: lysine--tRNA ligase [Planctomycetota bacterium]